MELTTRFGRRAVAVVGTRRDLRVVRVVDRLDLVPLTYGPTIPPSQTTGPFVLILVSADALATDDGQGCLRRLSVASPSAPIVLLVGDPADPGLLSRASRAGVSDVVDPADASGLAAVIQTQLMVADRRRERVLAIGAHPDDIEIGCAGALLNHRRQGSQVTFLTLSPGSNAQECLLGSVQAAAAVGAQLAMGDLADVGIDGGVDTIRLIEAVVGEVDPTTVYVHSVHDSHHDHRAVHAATLSATRRVPRLYAYQSPSATTEFRPNMFVEIDDFLTDKLDVLALSGSQRHRDYVDPDVVVANARYWAHRLMPHARYVEPFEVLRAMGDLPGRRPPKALLSSVSRLAASW